MRFVFLLRPPASRSIPCVMKRKGFVSKKMNTNTSRRGSSLLRKESGTHAKCARSRGRERTDERTRGIRERRTLSRQTLLEAKFSSVCETRGISLARPTRARSFHSSRPKTFPEHIEGTKSATRPSRHHTVTPLARDVFTRTFFRRKISLCLFARIKLPDATMHHPRLLQRRKR